MHDYIFKNHIQKLEIKKLQFTKALIVKGEVVNDSKQAFTQCFIKTGVYKISKNKYLNMLFPYVPFIKRTFPMDLNLTKHQSQEFKFFIEPFYYSKEFNVTIKADCR